MPFRQLQLLFLPHEHMSIAPPISVSYHDSYVGLLENALAGPEQNALRMSTHHEPLGIWVLTVCPPGCCFLCIL